MGNPTSPKEMWTLCLSLIKNNFGKRPIDTFPATRVMDGGGCGRGGEVGGRGGKKREKFDGIWKCVSLCVTRSHSHGPVQ